MITQFLKWLGVHVHEWSQWTETGHLTSVKHGGVIATVQSRTCTKCGKRQAEKIWLG